jgi:hypothetical protein
MAASTSETWSLGAPPNSVDAPENSFDFDDLGMDFQPDDDFPAIQSDFSATRAQNVMGETP